MFAWFQIDRTSLRKEMSAPRPHETDLSLIRPAHAPIFESLYTLDCQCSEKYSSFSLCSTNKYVLMQLYLNISLDLLNFKASGFFNLSLLDCNFMIAYMMYSHSYCSSVAKGEE